jgi:hypothetical protein
VPHFLSDAQKRTCVEASEELFRILQPSKTDDFNGIATADRSRFQYVCPSSTMPADAIPKVRPSLGRKKTTLFFPVKKPMAADVLPKGAEFNQLYFLHYIFPDLSKENMNCPRQRPRSPFSAHMDDSV